MNPTIYINIKSIGDDEWRSFKIKKALIAIVYMRMKEELPNIPESKWGGMVYEKYFTEPWDLEIPLYYYTAICMVEDGLASKTENCYNYVLYPNQMKVEQQIVTDVKSQKQSINLANKFLKKLKQNVPN
jgi:hypothetical protein